MVIVLRAPRSPAMTKARAQPIPVTQALESAPTPQYLAMMATFALLIPVTLCLAAPRQTWTVMMVTLAQTTPAILSMVLASTSLWLVFLAYPVDPHHAHSPTIASPRYVMRPQMLAKCNLSTAVMGMHALLTDVNPLPPVLFAKKNPSLARVPILANQWHATLKQGVPHIQ